MKLRYFGTDGIRGRYGEGFFTSGFIKKLGTACLHYLLEKKTDGVLRIAIGRDTRASGLEIESLFIEGIHSSGVEIGLLGVVPTPAVSLIAEQQGLDLAIMITASHNPAGDNGLKFFQRNGMKLSAEEEKKLEVFVDTVLAEEKQGASVINQIDGRGLYMEAIRRSVAYQDNVLQGKRIVVDAANGATVGISAVIFKELGAEVIEIGSEPNGLNINQDCGSEHSENLQKEVIANGADFGIAHDGDGDRVIVCDALGQVFPGEHIMGAVTRQYLAAKDTKGKTLVTTIQSNIGLDNAIEEMGGVVVRVDVGDKNVAHKMEVLDLVFGGENSGHYIFFDHSKSGDGLYSALMFIQQLTQQKTVAAMNGIIPLYPQVSKSFQVKDKKPIELLLVVQSAVEQGQAKMGKSGRILIRYSGTEPKIRLLVEGRDKKMIDEVADAIKEAIHQDLEVI